jgi:hypothetical protein
MKKRAKKKSAASAGGHLVTFRLSPEAFEALSRDAGGRPGVSHHQRAREIVLDYLTNRDTAELRSLLADLESKVLGVAELVRRDTYAVLVHAAKMENEKAKAWIRESMYDPLVK